MVERDADLEYVQMEGEIMVELHAYVMREKSENTLEHLLEDLKSVKNYRFFLKEFGAHCAPNSFKVCRQWLRMGTPSLLALVVLAHNLYQSTHLLKEITLVHSFAESCVSKISFCAPSALRSSGQRHLQVI